MTPRNPRHLEVFPQLAAANVSLRCTGRFAGTRRLSANGAPNRASMPAVRRFCRQAGSLIAKLWRETGLPRHWRFMLVLVFLSFLTAWAGTRALMAGFEETWTEIALSAARHENQALRTRQEILREQTEEALARLSAAETTPASAP